MNPHLLAYLCVFAIIGCVTAALIGAISWGDAGLIFVGTFVAAILNGFIMGSRLRNPSE